MQRLLVALVAGALLLAACGDDDTGADASGDIAAFGPGPHDSPTEDLGEVDEGIEGVHAFRLTYTSPPHREGDIDYGHSPSAGGLHNGDAYQCGFYDERLREEIVVHDLEHGAVWLSYAPDLPDDDLEVIHELARDSDEVLAAPYEGLEPGVAVVATAWARQLTLDSVDDPRLEEFVDEYQNGDQTPEQGVGCSIGSGNPIP